MKILLVAVNAKYIHSNLAVYSLKKAAERPAGEVEIAEYTINQQFFDILSDIYRRQPDVVAFSCYIWNRLMVEELMADGGRTDGRASEGASGDQHMGRRSGSIV